jgi:mRNA interferase MazF
MAKAGAVVWIEFPGAVATKRRPAVVLSSNDYHAARRDVIVGLVTSQISRAVEPTDHILVDWSAAGLRVPSAFRSYLATLPESTIISEMGRVSASDWREIQACLKRAMML